MTPADKDGLVSVDELSSILRTHEGPARPSLRPKPKRRLRLRWLVVAATVALLVGSGLGFGLGSWITPSGHAGRSFTGVGLLPARGWTVVQSGKGTTGASSVVAANMPIDPADHLSAVPRRTLEHLSRRGILIAAKVTPRGDPAVDLSFPVRRLPLRLADAQTVAVLGDFPQLSEYRLRAAIGGYNIEAAVYFGTPRASDNALASAQRQLGRLLVGAGGVTLFARPTIVDSATPTTTLFGSVNSGKSGEEVAIQAKDCGQNDFNVVTGTTTHEGGGWSWIYYPRINTTLRAVWKGEASAQIQIRMRAAVYLAKRRSGKGFRVSVFGQRSFWRKRVEIQRFTRQRPTWTTLRWIVLGSEYAADFTPRVPNGTLLRAVVPLSQARPCYLAGVSRTVRK